MWYEVRQEFGYENWSEGVFNSIEGATECILKEFERGGHGELIGYDLVNGVPNRIWWAEVRNYDINLIDNDDKDDINDFDTAYTLSDNDVIIIQFGTISLAERAGDLTPTSK